jgi:hypothetical protein
VTDDQQAFQAGFQTIDALSQSKRLGQHGTGVHRGWVRSNAASSGTADSRRNRNVSQDISRTAPAPTCRSFLIREGTSSAGLGRLK